MSYTRTPHATPAPMAQQPQTSHGTAEGHAPAAAETGLKPMLQDEPDLVMLVRLYPHAKSIDELKSLALAAGEAVREAGAKLVAAQQVPQSEQAGETASTGTYGTVGQQPQPQHYPPPGVPLTPPAPQHPAR